MPRYLEKMTWDHFKAALRFPRKYSAFTPLFYEMQYEASHTSEEKAKHAREAEETIQKAMNQLMPYGYYYDENGRFYIHQSPPNPIEQNSDPPPFVEEAPEGRPTILNGVEEYNSISTTDLKYLICLFFSWTTVYWFGFVNFTLSACVTMLFFWMIIQLLRGELNINKFKWTP